jgi:hypothetical protein
MIAEAQEDLYAVTFETSSSLYTIDSGSNQSTFIGYLGIDDVTDVVSTGTSIFGTTFNSFLSIDPNSGQAAILAYLGYSDVNALAVGKDGLFYAAEADSGNFISIDPVTFNTSFIGNYGAGISSSGDLAFSDQGRLYATVKTPYSNTDWLGEVDISNGEIRLIGDLGYNDVFGLSFKQSKLYGVTYNGELLEINKNTGYASSIGNTSFNLYGGLGTRGAGYVDSDSDGIPDLYDNYPFVLANTNCIEDQFGDVQLQNALFSGIVTCSATNDVVTGNNVTVEETASVEFIAGDTVRLLPGFRVEKGSYFQASIL